MDFLRKWKQKLEEMGYWEVLSYLFFGGLTTLVNIITFSALYYFLSINMYVANSIAWLVSVLFAFVTNKLWVFQSKSRTFGQMAWEFGKFIFYRILSLGIDNGALALVVDVFKWPSMAGKLISQVLVVAANYVFSKLFIFKKK